VRSWPVKGWQKEQFYMEPYIAIDDKQDRVYITDPTKHRVHKFTREGEFLGFIETDPESGEPLGTPLGVGINQETGMLYVTDMSANRLYKFKP